MDGSLRPGSMDVFQKLVCDGHHLYVWSGVGIRTSDMERLELTKYISGIFVKPLKGSLLEKNFYKLMPDFQEIIDRNQLSDEILVIAKKIDKE